MTIAITPPSSNLSATALELIDPSWTPNVGINFEYRLLNSDGEICSPRKRVDFDGTDYANWGGGDDSYVIERVAAKLGLTVA
jgi:hypothetical protein